MKRITIYNAPACHLCHLAVEFFQQEGLPYTEHDVSEDPEKRAEMVALSGQHSVPVIYLHDPEDPSENEVIIGFNEEELRQSLTL